jgi:probable phosphoglycerate mutase
VRTRFIVVRHGETEWNVERRIQGQGDSALTAAGIAQADAIGRRLARERFDRLVASDLGRARHTAERIARCCGEHPVETDARLRERHFGVGEGLTYEEIDRRFPDAFSRVRHVDPDFTIPEGESRRAFHVRVARAFEDLALRHAGERLAVVTHGGVLAALYRHIHGIPVGVPHAIPISNAAYNAVVFTGEAWEIEAWDDLAHLDTAARFEES